MPIQKKIKKKTVARKSVSAGRKQVEKKRIVKPAKKTVKKPVVKKTGIKKKSMFAELGRNQTLLQENKRLASDVRKYKHQLEMIRKTSFELTRETPISQTLASLAKAASEFFNADAVSCMHWDVEKKQMLIKAGYGFKTDYIKRQVIPSRSIRPFLENGVEHAYFENIQETPQGDVGLIREEGLVSVLSIFLKFGNTVLGAINLYSRGRIRKFTDEELENAKLFAQHAAITVQNANLYKEMKEEAQIAKTLLQVAEEVGALNSLQDVLNRVVIILTSALKFHLCAVFLWDEKKKIFLPAKAIGLPPHRSPLFQTLILRKEDLNFTDKELEQRSVISTLENPGRFPMEKISSVLHERDLRILPLVTKGKMLGIIGVGGFYGKQNFGYKDELFLRGIAAEAAIGIDDANLFEALDAAFWDIIKSLAAAIEVKDNYTHSHSESVTSYATALGEALALDEMEMKLLNKACLLHDLGKIGIEDRILQKETPLTFEERMNIERHPVIGSQLLQSVGSLADVAEIVRFHHEKYDGTGYPDRLKGEAIPRLARVLAVADSFDAMTSDRPYRKALSYHQAVDQLRTCSGLQFDPDLVDVFLQVLDKKKIKWGLVAVLPE
ncbi:HD domain-containing protein [bacterium]|nr:HD domain-containing protein [bacterium]